VEEDDVSSKPFSERLREVREAAGLSQGGLAARAGLTRQALSLLESGQREPAWETVQRLAAGLGVDCTAFADPSIKAVEVPVGEPADDEGEATRAQKPRRPARSGEGGAANSTSGQAKKPARKKRGE
jgi:transcriptional regulator with XRE-family HTH domain